MRGLIGVVGVVSLSGFVGAFLEGAKITARLVDFWSLGLISGIIAAVVMLTLEK